MTGYFEGWYLKCQSDTQTLAVIPAFHRAGEIRTCSIQIITEDNAWVVEFPENMWKKKKEIIQIGKNQFSNRGIRLSIHTSELDVTGKINFGPLTPLKYDIMGPFALVPFMECRHGVWSMRHRVAGNIYVNGQEYAFHNALGYWEGDRGSSFPKRYAWTQHIFPEGSLMLSVADIPLAGIHFTGIIGVVLWRGREYRLATYLGARVLQNEDGRLRIVQGKMELEAQLLERPEHILKAPSNGNMIRTIRESVTCRVFYQFRIGGHRIFAFETEKASFEYEY